MIGLLASNALFVAGVGAVCLLLSAFFSGCETGYMSVSRVRLRRSGRENTGRGRMLLRHLARLEEPILACLIGTNLFNVFFSAVATYYLNERFGAQGDWLAVLVVSTLVILLGEILPKVLFREFPERLALAAAPAVELFLVISAPVRWVLRGYRRIWERIVPFGEDAGAELDRRGLTALLLTNSVPSTTDRRFVTVLDRFLKLAQRPLTAIMRPLETVDAVTEGTTVGDCLAKAAQSGYSRLPVVDADGTTLQAYVLVRDLLFLPRELHDRPVPRRLWRTILQVDARLTPYELFEELRHYSRQLAAVTDPAGNPLGMITLEDLIETVMGSIQDEFDPEAAGPAA